MRLESESPIEVECASCRGTGERRLARGGDPDWCPFCGGYGYVFLDLATLAHNLAIAGALCVAFEAGNRNGVNYCARCDGFPSVQAFEWEPNVASRAMPGFDP